MQHLFEFLYIGDGIVFLFIMLFLTIMTKDQQQSVVRIRDPLPSRATVEHFCTCRGAQYNNSAADVQQANCYKDKIPPNIWNQSYAGCTCQDPDKTMADYVEGKQLPLFSGV